MQYNSIEDILDSWNHNRVELDIAETERDILDYLYNAAQTRGNLLSHKEIIDEFFPEENYSTLPKEISNLVKKDLIIFKNGKYRISKKGFEAYESEFEVKVKIMDRIYYGHLKGFREVYMPYIAKGCTIMDYEIITQHLKDLEKQELVELISKNRYINVKATSLGRKVGSYIRKNNLAIPVKFNSFQ